MAVLTEATEKESCSQVPHCGYDRATEMTLYNTEFLSGFEAGTFFIDTLCCYLY